MDADTHMSPGTLTAALRAAGGAIRAVDMVMSGEAGNVFVANPASRAITASAKHRWVFVFFGNVALAAKHALEHHGLSRCGDCGF